MNDVARQQLSADSRVLAITPDDVNDSMSTEKMPFRMCADTRKKCQRDGTIFRHSSVFDIELAASRVDTRRVSACGDADFRHNDVTLRGGRGYKRDLAH